MKRLLLSAVAVLAAAPAFAADMAVKAPPPAPAPVAVYDWTGFYIGANGGWAQSHNCLDFVTAGGIVADGCATPSGGVVGGQIGYRWQTNQFVFGIEGQGDWADITNTRLSLVDPAVSIRSKTDAIGLITGQLGWAWNAALLYVKGGAAVTGSNVNVFDTATGLGLASASSTRWGATVGVGFEYGFSPGWSIGAEYDHLFMGHSDNTFAVVSPVFLATGARVSQDIDMVTLRLNYKFNLFGLGGATGGYPTGGYPTGTAPAQRY